MTQSESNKLQKGVNKTLFIILESVMKLNGSLRNLFLESRLLTLFTSFYTV